MGRRSRAGAAAGRVGAAGVEFDRHVASLFGRLGCNAGSCHGSFQGRGGLNLSLFGADPARDFQAIAREASGRRVNVLDPDRSLVLLKATGQVPHEGGQRFAPGSWEYRVIRAWIADGARRDPARPAARAIEIRPAESRLERPGATGRLAVVARFADGTQADVTAFCDLRVRDTEVADVSNTGAVRGLRPGDTAVVASYNGLVAAARVLVPTGRTVSVPDVPASDIIDREVYAKLRALGIEPSGPAEDAEFLRRVTLDVIGTLPTPGEVRAFLADGSCDKRSRTIDRLLAHPMHAALWATRYLDITGCDVNAMEGPAGAPRPPGPALARLVPGAVRREYPLRPDRPRRALRDQPRRAGRPRLGPSRGRADAKAPGRGRDRLRRQAGARLLLAAAGQRAKPPRSSRWPSGSPRLSWASASNAPSATSTRSTAGPRPTTGRSRTSSRTSSSASPPTASPRSPPCSTSGARPIRRAPCPRSRASARSISRPGPPAASPTPTPAARSPRAPWEGPSCPTTATPVERLFDWLAAPENPYFARSFVNRVWAVYFGAGLVDPVDGFSVTNPPSNPRLLDALAADFVAHGYDIRRLERLVLNSRAYQRSSQPVAGNLDDRGNFARSMPRPLMAEVLVDAINAALDVPGDFGPDAPKGSRAIEIATNRVASPDLARAFRVFGRPERAAVCDCERPKAPALPQTLFLMTDDALLARLKSGRVGALAGSDRCDAEAVEELFLAALSRPPAEDEARSALDHLRTSPDRASGLADVLWALINTREFVLNH